MEHTRSSDAIWVYHSKSCHGRKIIIFHGAHQIYGHDLDDCRVYHTKSCHGRKIVIFHRAHLIYIDAI